MAAGEVTCLQPSRSGQPSPLACKRLVLVGFNIYVKQLDLACIQVIPTNNRSQPGAIPIQFHTAPWTHTAPVALQTDLLFANLLFPEQP
eukprot:g12998.t1